MTEKDILRGDRAALERQLKQDGAQIKGRAVLCPYHEDHHPSGSIYEKDGIWRYKCMACGVGGDVFDLMALANKTTPADELKKLAEPKPQKRQAAEKALSFPNLEAVRTFLTGKVGKPIYREHTYTTADGDYFETILGFKLSDKPKDKTFYQAHLSDAGYVLRAPEKPWKLYNLPALTDARVVIVVEGEHKVDCLNKYGFTATTSPGGALSAKNADWTPLAGKQVVIWPDNDAKGQRYAADVQRILEGL